MGENVEQDEEIQMHSTYTYMLPLRKSKKCEYIYLNILNVFIQSKHYFRRFKQGGLILFTQKIYLI